MLYLFPSNIHFHTPIFLPTQGMNLLFVFHVFSLSPDLSGSGWSRYPRSAKKRSTRPGTERGWVPFNLLANQTGLGNPRRDRLKRGNRGPEKWKTWINMKSGRRAVIFLNIWSCSGVWDLDLYISTWVKWAARRFPRPTHQGAKGSARSDFGAFRHAITPKIGEPPIRWYHLPINHSHFGVPW